MPLCPGLHSLPPCSTPPASFRPSAPLCPLPALWQLPPLHRFAPPYSLATSTDAPSPRCTPTHCRSAPRHLLCSAPLHSLAASAGATSPRRAPTVAPLHSPCFVPPPCTASPPPRSLRVCSCALARPFALRALNCAAGSARSARCSHRWAGRARSPLCLRIDSVAGHCFAPAHSHPLSLCSAPPAYAIHYAHIYIYVA